MKIIDISWPLSEVITGYKNRKTVAFEPLKTFDKNGVRESAVWLTAHSGTHIDAPSHMLRDGKTIDELPLDRFMGPCVVLDATNELERITRACFDDWDPESIKPGDIVLFKTANSLKSPTEKFASQFVYLEASGADYLVEKKVKAVGVDYLGIERDQPEHVTHHALFTHDIGIIEGLRLTDVPAGRYMFICLPLNLIGLDGAPARAVLIEGL